MLRLQPATESEPEHPTASDDASAADTASAMYKNRGAAQGISVDDLHEVIIKSLRIYRTKSFGNGYSERKKSRLASTTKWI